jgi:hypothetical protein
MSIQAKQVSITLLRRPMMETISCELQHSHGWSKKIPKSRHVLDQIDNAGNNVTWEQADICSLQTSTEHDAGPAVVLLLH